MEAATGRPEAKASKPAAARDIVYRRNPAIRGPMSAFGYDYFSDHYGAARSATIRLLGFEGARGEGGDYAYEVLNFVDGKRTVTEIRDAVSAIYGPIPVDVVAEYLAALLSIEVVQRQTPST
jgi:aminopeptidase YwaD